MEKENSYTNDYLLDRQVKILQPVDGYRASTDAVFLSSLVDEKKNKRKCRRAGCRFRDRSGFVMFGSQTV